MVPMLTSTIVEIQLALQPTRSGVKSSQDLQQQKFNWLYSRPCTSPRPIPSTIVEIQLALQPPPPSVQTGRIYNSRNSIGFIATGKWGCVVHIYNSRNSIGFIASTHDSWVQFYLQQQKFNWLYSLLINLKLPSYIYNSRNSIGFIARLSNLSCRQSIYNSRNSIGFIARWVTTHSFRIYNSRNSIGFIAYANG